MINIIILVIGLIIYSKLSKGKINKKIGMLYKIGLLIECYCKV